MNNNIIEYDEIVEAEVKEEKKYKSVVKWALGNKFFKMLGMAIMLIVTVFSVGFGIKYKIKYEEVKAERDQLIADMQDSDTITDIVIEEKLSELSELSTVSFTYSGKISEDDYRPLFNTGYDIKSTKNQVNIVYEGVIKAGYDVKKIESKIEPLSKTVYMKLPNVEIFDNYIKHDSLIIEEKDNPLNPISTEEVKGYLVKVEEEKLENAIEQGLYEDAEVYMKNLVSQYFAEFSEYNIVFL